MVLLPAITSVKLMLVGFAVRVPPTTAVPERGTTIVGELLALLEMTMLPVPLPAAVGAKLTVREAVCPIASVLGTDKALLLKSAPFTVT